MPKVTANYETVEMCIRDRMYSSESIKYFLNLYMQVPIEYDLTLMGNLGTLINVLNIVQLALMFVVATSADRLYYKHVVREIKKLRSTAPATLSRDQYLTMLAVKDVYKRQY